MPEKLKPCPFCGYPAIDAGQIDSQGTLEICCSHCGAMIRELDYKQLVDEWNRRAQQPNEPLTVDELRRMDGQPVWIDDWYQDFHGWELSVDAMDYLENRDLSQYGSQWLAYRRPPEAGEKG